MTVIIGIKLQNKLDNAVEMQKILTKYNCIIKLRIGISNNGLFCSDNGIILLQAETDDKEIELEKDLLNIDGIELQRMIF
jgi:hypothetical protein